MYRLFAPDSEEAHQIWRTALRSLALTYDGNTVHPYLALMRLVRERPGIEAARLALALESNDDSEEEFQRILALADRPDWDAVLLIWESVSTKPVTRRKYCLHWEGKLAIFVTTGRDIFWSSCRSCRIQSSAGHSTPTSQGQTARCRTWRETEKSEGDTQRQSLGLRTLVIARLTNRTFQTRAVTAEIRRERLDTPRGVLFDQWPDFCPALDYDLAEDPYDILASNSERPSVLLEIKTLDGSLPDEIAQVRSALGQLLYYEVFHVPADL